MTTSGQIGVLQLVYPPISNQEAYWLRDDKEVEASLRQSDFYLIGGRCEAEFLEPQWDPDAREIHFRLGLTNGVSDSGMLRVMELPGVERMDCGSCEIEVGKKLIRIWDGKVGAPGSNVVEWFTTDAMLFWRARGRAGIYGLDNHRELSQFELFYVGIAKTGDSFERLVKNGHSKRMDIMANEPQRHPLSRVTDETYLFLFRLETMGFQTFDTAEDVEDYGKFTNISPKKVVADAEKAFVKLLDPQYNLTKYTQYPKGIDGLYDSGLTRYAYVLGESMIFHTSTATIKGAYGPMLGFSNDADCIFVQGDAVELFVAGKDFPST